jgi:N-acetylglucosamine-6-sulfatase
MTDDQDRASLASMTEVNRLLVANGVTYDQSLVSYPECCPSRATFLTGQYAHNHGVLSNEAPEGGYSAFDDRNALPVWLRNAGYTTAFVGKYLNGYGAPIEGNDPRAIPRGWDWWYGLTDHTEYDMHNYTLNENGKLVSYGLAKRDYQTDVLANKAVSFLHRPTDNPFFLWVATAAPHERANAMGVPLPPIPAPRDEGRFRDTRLPNSPALNEANVSDKPSFVQEPPLSRGQLRFLTFLKRSRLQSLAAVDRLVARLVSALEARGELDNTVFIFTSDNGFLLGQHRLAGKDLAYEQSIGVPLVIRGPGFPAGEVSHDVVANTDLAPTIAQLAKARPSVRMDGISLFDQRALRRRPGVLLELLSSTGGQFPPIPLPGLLQRFRGVRTQRYAYWRYASGDQELYDLRKDPDEVANMAAAKRYAHVADRLSAITRALARCAGASCRHP